MVEQLFSREEVEKKGSKEEAKEKAKPTTVRPGHLTVVCDFMTVCVCVCVCVCRFHYWTQKRALM